MQSNNAPLNSYEVYAVSDLHNPPLTLTSYTDFSAPLQPSPYYPFTFNSYSYFPWFLPKIYQDCQNQTQYFGKSQAYLTQQIPTQNLHLMSNQEHLVKKQQDQLKAERKDTSAFSIKIEQGSQYNQEQSLKQKIIQGQSEISNKFNRLQSKNQIDDIQDQKDPQLAEIIQELIIFILNNFNQSDEFLKKFRNKFVNDSCVVWKQSFGPDFSCKINELFKILIKKFKKFKKTKEQMVKYIFRRAYNIKNKPSYLPEGQYRTSVLVHNKNLQEFKSMNCRFIQKEFQSPYFRLLFDNFIENFDNNFQEQNAERIKRLRKLILQDYRKGNFSLIQSEKKLAWTYEYKKKIKNICNQYKSLLQNGNFQQKIFKNIKKLESNIIQAQQPKKNKRTTRKRY